MRNMETEELLAVARRLLERPDSSQSDDAGAFRSWVLEEWRRASIPQWRDILAKARAQHDAPREEYARWMLRDILLDPEYEESVE